MRLIIECRGNGVPQALAQQGAAVAAPSPHIFAHAPRRLGGPADRETDLSCRAQRRRGAPQKPQTEIYIVFRRETFPTDHCGYFNQFAEMTGLLEALGSRSWQGR